MMEPEQFILAAEKGLQNGSSTKKICKKCGFDTFNLHSLYAHKRKCKGELLSTVTCYHCKRQFNFLFLYKLHKKYCLEYHIKKKMCLVKSKLLQKKYFGEGSPKKQLGTENTWVCKICKNAFASSAVLKIHLKKGTCIKQHKHEKYSFSARKSFSKSPSMFKKMKCMPSNIENPDFSNGHKIPGKYKTNSNFICKWCKSKYPTKEILLKHFGKNVQCARFYFKQKHKSHHERSLTARKSMPIVAKKSFSGSKSKNYFQQSTPVSKGSARKSMSNSSTKKFRRSEMTSLSSPSSSQNQCPVCYVKFRDSFNFFQHQKKYNHWGKAAKSTNLVCKCPFCDKQFYHLRARNAHIRNHADKSEEDIKFFLRKTTCNVCSQIFVSEIAKYQHMKIEHPKPDPSKENHPKHSLLPLIIKQKLKLYPHTCPICSKEFPSTYYRDKHFQGRHLDSELECKFCPLKYTSVDSLEYHMQEAHYDSFKFECLLCKINLATAPHVVLHVTKVHPDKDTKNIIRCRVSESALLSDDNAGEVKAVQEIEEQDKNNEIYCDICEITFQKKCGLQSHRQSKFHKDMLVKSLDAMHESVSNLPSPPRKTLKVKEHPEILTCNECSEDFSTVKDFVPHRLSHFGKGKYLKINELNMYKCEICGEVSNSHSKVQMHLFWHLQVESTSSERGSIKAKKQDTIVADVLSGQIVAKKSFNKSSDPKNEVIIGGIRKPLFTCDACHIGFTTQAHYSLHIRRFCRVRNASKEAEKKLTANMAFPKSRKESSKSISIRHCSICKCLFKSQIEKVHERFCDNSTPSSSHVTSVKKLKEEMESQCSVAVCIACSQLFNDPREFSKHMLDHNEAKENSISNENNKASTNPFENIVLCTSCNCLFLTRSAQSNHELFCESSSYHTFDAEDSKDILKPALELEGATAMCIKCCLAFTDVQKLKEHIMQHQDQSMECSASFNGLTSECLLGSIVKENSLPDDFAVSLLPDSIPGISDTSVKSLIRSVSKDKDDSLENQDPIDMLRKNFSKLLCILINDSDLMNQLGYGLQPVDDVLVNVLQQMGQAPILKNDNETQIGCLRENISILLDFCLKDQIMELIGNGKTSVDDIVVEALKMFSSEETSSLTDAE